MHEDDLFRVYLQERERRERAIDEVARMVEQAGAVYAPVLAPPAAPPALTPPPSPPTFADNYDRLLTYPIWVAWVTLTHAVILLASLGVPLFIGAMLAVALSAFLGIVPGVLVGGSLVLATVIGTARDVYRSYRDELSQFPW